MQILANFSKIDYGEETTFKFDIPCTSAPCRPEIDMGVVEKRKISAFFHKSNPGRLPITVCHLLTELLDSSYGFLWK